MIDYVEEDTVCRSRVLLIYFGEKNPGDCGVCDVCLRKNETGLSNFEFNQIKEQLLEVLHSDGPQRINNLVDSLPELNSEKVIRVIRNLIDQGDIWLNDDILSLADKS